MPFVFPSAPCAPENISVALECDQNTGVVSWLASSGAVGYNVTARGGDGDIKHCSSSNTSCQLPNMHCAQTYEIVVTPFSETCKGFDSHPLTYIAGTK